MGDIQSIGLHAVVFLNHRIQTLEVAPSDDYLVTFAMKSLGQGDDQIAAFADNSVIIGDRNAKCLRVLRKQVRKKGRRNLGIFYGAAHNPDLEARLLKMGYWKGKQEWMTAWDVPKAVPKPVDDGKKAEEGETEKAVPRSR